MTSTPMPLPNPIPEKRDILNDSLSRRLQVAIVASVLGNLALWSAAASVAVHPVHSHDPRPVEITRVIIHPDGKRVEKVVVPKKIVHKIVPPKPEPPKPVVHHEPPPKPAPVVHRAPVPQPTPQTKVTPPARALPPPPTAHNRVLTAPDNKMAPAKSDDHVALAGGNADPGKPMPQQGAGNAKVNPDVPVKPMPQPVAPPTPMPQPAPEKKPEAPAPPVREPVKVEPPKVEQPMPEPVKPKKKGPTKEAEPTDQTKPEIPDSLKHSDFKSFVRVAVDIDEDGSFTVNLRTSSGNPEIDNRVLEALKKWKWKPALKNGEPIKSVQRFKFEFLVE